MPQIECTIDPATGELQLHIRGIAGPACEDVAKLVHDLLGKPGQERNTPEYYLRPRVRSQIRPRSGR